MNTYRVMYRCSGDTRRRMFNVDATTPTAAIRKAMASRLKPTDDVDVSVRLYAEKVRTVHGQPPVRRVPY